MVTSEKQHEAEVALVAILIEKLRERKIEDSEELAKGIVHELKETAFRQVLSLLNSRRIVPSTLRL